MGCEPEKLDPRVKRTRQLLQKSLGELLRERDFAAISVQDVAERATVNRATFYAHYPDKEALLASIVQEELREHLHSRFEALPSLTLESLTAMFAAILEFVSRSSQGCPKGAQKIKRLIVVALEEEIHALFREWLRNSTSNPFRGHDKEVVATLLTTTVLGFASSASRPKGLTNPTKLAEAIVGVLLPGGEASTESTPLPPR